MEKYRYNFEYTDRKRFYEYFKQALANTNDLLIIQSRRIQYIEEKILLFQKDRLDDGDAPYNTMTIRELLMQDKDALTEIGFASWLGDQLFVIADTPVLDSVLMVLEMYAYHDKLEAMAERQEANMNIWDERVMLYAPVFEKQSQEVNANWDRVWEKAKVISQKNPDQIPLMMILKDYPQERQDDPATFSQDVKNQAYLAADAQIKFIEISKSKGFLKKVQK